MNRRIPNGTYGGAGGRRLAAFSYPIIQRRYTLGLLRYARNDRLFWDCHVVSLLAMTREADCRAPSGSSQLQADRLVASSPPLPVPLSPPHPLSLSLFPIFFFSSISKKARQTKGQDNALLGRQDNKARQARH